MQLKVHTIGSLAEYLKSRVITLNNEDLNKPISGVNSLAGAQDTEMSFLTNAKYLPDLQASQAGAVIVKEPLPAVQCCQLIHANPQLAMAEVASLFYERDHHFSGLSPLAYVDRSAVVDPEATVFPFAYIGAGAKISKGAVIYPYVYVGANSSIGESSVLFAQAQIMESCSIGANCLIFGGAVIGADGFGFVPTALGQKKIPQMGTVVIEDDVEIGPLSTVDRATFGITRIKKGSKLDAHVHVGHNVEVGEHTLLCAQVGVAGSTTIGDRCIAGGQVGFANGIKVGSGMVFGGQAGVTASMTGPGVYHGMPAQPAKQWTRQMIALERLPELLKRVQALEEQLEQSQRKD